MYHFSNLFSVNDEAPLRMVRSGEMTVMVIDNFLTNPDKVLDLAQSLDYGIMRGPREYRAYPGERAVISHNPHTMYEKVLEKYKALLEINKKEPEKCNGKADGSAFACEPSAYSPHPVMFTKMNAQAIAKLHPRQKTPHIDSDATLSGLIYLTPDRDCTGGTAFYRHRSTGISYFPPAPSSEMVKQMRGTGFDPLKASDYDSFQLSVTRADIDYISTLSGTGLDHESESWEAPKVVEMRFNRLILFPATLIHSPIYEPTGEMSDGVARITQNFFFRKL